jgi:hypothetical protein
MTGVDNRGYVRQNRTKEPKMAKILVDVSFDYELPEWEVQGFTVEQVKKMETRVLRNLLKKAFSDAMLTLDEVDIRLETADKDGNALMDEDIL